jgi:hypothetical protein
MTELTRDEKAALIRWGRFAGMSPDRKAAMDKANAELEWYGWCRKCGKSLKGLLTELKEHRCGS